MSSTIKLPSGKLIDLSRFVALLPDEKKAENHYKLSLAGLDKAIELDSFDADFISKKLEFKSDTNNSHLSGEWDKEAQLHQNQPLMKLIKQWREQKNAQPATAEEIQEYQEIQEALKRNHSTEQTSKV